jgi:signal transduction histidine kinase
MIVPEDFSLQKRFRYLEWLAILLAAGAQLMWTLAAVKLDYFIQASFFFLILTFIVSAFTPQTQRWQVIQLIGQTLLITISGALGAHHFVYLYLYVIAAKAALFLPRAQMLAIGIFLAASHILAGRFAVYALNHIHIHRHPEIAYYRSIILEGQTTLYLIIALITVIFLGRILSAERKSLSTEQSLIQKIEDLAVRLERARIARDIHDGLGSTLTSLRIRLELVLKFLEERKSKEALELLTWCQNSAGSALAEVRRAVRAENDRDLNLRQAVAELADQINEQGALKVNAHLNEISLSLSVQHQLFKIIQECLTNASKHSSATHLEITLKQNDGIVCLCVRDNGNGFDVTSSNSGFGLKSLRERAQTIGAAIKIESRIGEGTDVFVQFSAIAGQLSVKTQLLSYSTLSSI